MNTHKRKVLSVLLTVLVLSILITPPVLAQEETGGFTEDFESGSLAGWDTTQDVLIDNGVLTIGPDNLIHKNGNWIDIELDLRIKFSFPGEVAINYYVREGEEYSLVLHENSTATVIKNINMQITPLAEGQIQNFNDGDWNDIKIQVDGGTHTITVNQQVALTATDSEPLTSGGGVTVHAFVQSGVELDSISLTGTASGVPVSEGQPGEPGEEGLPQEGEPQPGGEEVPGGEEMPGGEPQTTGEGAQTSTDGGTGTSTTSTGPLSLLEEFMSGQSNQLELSTFLVNLILAVITSFILGRVYIYWGSSLSNRRTLASNFMLLTVTTTFIILVVRSSVALSLGLVGALSIVRFRAAVKEPEELAYLFFAISLGIGLGDNQRLITLLTLLVGIVVIGLLHFLRSTGADVNLHLTIASRSPNKINLDQVTAVLEKHCSKIKLLRLDETEEMLETSYVIEFKRVSDLSQAKAELQALSPALEISFLDNKGIW